MRVPSEASLACGTERAQSWLRAPGSPGQGRRQGAAGTDLPPTAAKPAGSWRKARGAGRALPAGRGLPPCGSDLGRLAPAPGLGHRGCRLSRGAGDAAVVGMRGQRSRPTHPGSAAGLGGCADGVRQPRPQPHTRSRPLPVDLPPPAGGRTRGCYRALPSPFPSLPPSASQQRHLTGSDGARKATAALRTATGSADPGTGIGREAGGPRSLPRSPAARPPRPPLGVGGAARCPCLCPCPVPVPVPSLPRPCLCPCPRPCPCQAGGRRALLAAAARPRSMAAGAAPRKNVPSLHRK